MVKTKGNQKIVGMHPRNVLRTQPDYTKMAIKYKDFREQCQLELNGKVSVNFRNEKTLRELTKMLLKEYYDLDVDFAPGSLVPTLALRLNYILWLEDLMEPLSLQVIRGIDIGCGSSCIYSLLGAKKNGWHMLALESKPQNIEYAMKNVKKNHLESLIEVYAQPDNTNIFKSYFEQDQRQLQYQFCLCNPPFFDSNLPNPLGGNTRNPERRPAPNNARTGSQEELTCVGGEVQFVQRIIDESLENKERVRIYTTMLGVKANVPRILDYLKEQQVANVSTTEFHQGHTTRWAVAWSFHSEPLQQGTTLN
ncbi:U6 small nuclear RNA (adenine-(43)-N(6))-methyltransferase [Drosophila sechellia]|uniref:U6 small nuclear RNA (adenine-(43)-N(6))-methyltransferase n=1 Tax=Drosophila sechellia TaxID=7238 RepID=B4HRT8_DROSE|nr:U6 small nuclear RNA (adenine-(43)-N(6))-methyltransferase [Drosophila sechellia]XP_032572026.1 U6 small nuclear RNA (adenine-(43)-N(6))-methyltransferase [Drosophila sechellia]XP_032572027.1 U6 small nuclear RNA (adenine-(43)-N(6))-methyltransferase [Drosophila sechellia]XP_032572028.1 U6 small nuclear RNA (adenine-(43)-N(6))-methyltransferase [Drosophila sechellia]EDW47952.1 GM21591 [Drosophila sechellia]